MPKYKLIAADLDGTLLDDTYRVKPQLLAAVNAARSLGVELAVITGRLYPSALPFAVELNVTLPVIASNGAVVKDPLTGKLISQITMDRDLAIEALNLTENGTSQRFVNVQDAFYTDVAEEESRKYAEALKINFVRKIPLQDAIITDPVMVVIRDSESEITRLTGILAEHFGNKVYMANSKPFFIDINGPKVSKGAALKDLCSRMGITPEEVVAIGDGWNDREMLQTAGLGAVVANAPESLKEHADYVCEQRSFQGVIEVIKRFVLTD
ncbi:Cof-type HAD-IIB family hydrolase [Phosphitispora sp. TUW77]|uniref:Cof-type HAD-IIB family hydrolase n=1 Tax=Phosphitispora sp. TUW77 TaxID=3152361 RepID=UPI003AB2ADA3